MTLLQVVTPGTFEFELFFILTLIILIVKALLATYLGIKVFDKKKETGKFQLDFISSVFILMIGLFISRVLYTIFDFALTEFDANRFYLVPNLYYWKAAGFIASAGFVLTLFVVDKKALNFKLKGIPAIILLIIMFIQLLYPVNNSEDFTFVSQIGLMTTGVGLLIPIMFLYLGIKTPGLRKVCFMIAFAVIIYGFGSILVSEGILDPLRATFGPDIHITMFFLFLVFKTIGLTMMTYGVVNFQI